MKFNKPIELNTVVQAYIDKVDEAISQESKLMDERLDAENSLRKQAKDLCGVALDVSEIEELNCLIANTRPGFAVPFKPKRSSGPVVLIKTQFGVVARAETYIFGLESTVINLTNERQELLNKIQSFTDLSFFDLIKLSFQKFVKGRNNGKAKK